jgi:hypothetical protein
MDEFLPFSREGMWMSPHHFWNENAYDLLIQYNRTFAEYSERVGPDPKPEVPPWCTDEHTAALRQRLFATHALVLVSCCLVIEGFINYYGVRRLGGEFFKRNIERLGITEKLSVIVAILFHKKLENSDALWTSVRSLFDERNGLVHPKCKELTKEIIQAFEPPDEPFLNAPDREIKMMESILTAFCEYDPDIIKEFEYGEPNKRLQAIGAKARLQPEP